MNLIDHLARQGMRETSRDLAEIAEREKREAVATLKNVMRWARRDIDDFGGCPANMNISRRMQQITAFAGWAFCQIRKTCKWNPANGVIYKSDPANGFYANSAGNKALLVCKAHGIKVAASRDGRDIKITAPGGAFCKSFGYNSSLYFTPPPPCEGLPKPSFFAKDFATR